MGVTKLLKHSIFFLNLLKIYSAYEMISENMFNFLFNVFSSGLVFSSLNNGANSWSEPYFTK